MITNTNTSTTITRSNIEQPKTHLTILDLARAAAKEQWSTGESQWIWGDKANGAYLKNVTGYIRLYLTRRGAPGLNIFMLGSEHNWVEVKGLDAKYAAWKEKVNQDQVGQGQASNLITKSRWHRMIEGEI
jgi:hypothetical protein